MRESGYMFSYEMNNKQCLRRVLAAYQRVVIRVGKERANAHV